MTAKRFTLKHFESQDWAYDNGTYIDTRMMVELLNELHEENQRLTDKLNQTALELVDGVISQGKAVEISEMSYREFLDYIMRLQQAFTEKLEEMK